MKMAKTQKKGKYGSPSLPPNKVDRYLSKAECCITALLSKAVNDANNGERGTGHSPLR